MYGERRLRSRLFMRRQELCRPYVLREARALPELR
jgi:hypothetical protein